MLFLKKFQHFLPWIVLILTLIYLKISLKQGYSKGYLCTISFKQTKTKNERSFKNETGNKYKSGKHKGYKLKARCKYFNNLFCRFSDSAYQLCVLRAGKRFT